MQQLLLIGASNVASQEIIKSLDDGFEIIGVTIEEDSDRHKRFMALDLPYLKKEVLDITQGKLAWLESLVEKYGEFDSCIYVPCANSEKSYLDITSDDFDKSVELNGKLPFLISQKLIPSMLEKGYGRFVFFSSKFAILGQKEKGYEYAITKPMLNQLSKQITAAYMYKGVTATSLMFGNINMHQRNDDESRKYGDAEREVKPEEVADFVKTMLLDSSKRSFAGATVFMDSGPLVVNGTT